MKNSMGIIAAFLGGAIVGGALGVLFAPESGEETRKKIIAALKKRGIELDDNEIDGLMNDLKSEVSQQETDKTE